MRPYDRLVVTANENNEGYITFTTDDFDLETVPGISANDKLPRLSFLKFGKRLPYRSPLFPIPIKYSNMMRTDMLLKKKQVDIPANVNLTH